MKPFCAPFALLIVVARTKFRAERLDLRSTEIQSRNLGVGWQLRGAALDALDERILQRIWLDALYLSGDLSPACQIARQVLPSVGPEEMLLALLLLGARHRHPAFCYTGSRPDLAVHVAALMGAMGWGEVQCSVVRSATTANTTIGPSNGCSVLCVDADESGAAGLLRKFLDRVKRDGFLVLLGYMPERVPELDEILDDDQLDLKEVGSSWGATVVRLGGRNVHGVYHKEPCPLPRGACHG